MHLKELSEAVGVSGQEDAVRKIILNVIDGHAEQIRIDPIGSITALKKGTGKDLPRVMLAAHMDEIGFMVTGFDNGGLIRFVNVGGIDARILPGLRVKVGKDLMPGVVIWPPIHMGNNQSAKAISDLRIDVGASSKEGLNGKVRVGDRIAFDSKYMEIGDYSMRGKAFDDRVGCSLLIDVLQGGPYPVDILAAFTAQEEVGLRGARVAAQYFDPDVAFVLECTTAHDLPDPTADTDSDEEINPTTRLGEGPALTAIDRRIITDPRLLNFLRQTAESNDIPYQFKTRRGGGTDAGAIHIANGGIPSAVISAPCRYIHSPAALMRRSDYEDMLRLVQAALRNLTFDTLARED